MTTKTRDPMVGTVIGGASSPTRGYKILDKIAEGGIGTTYKAEHILTGLPVCIKICKNPKPRDAKMKAFMRKILIEESLAMGKCRHFTIPSFMDLIEMNDADESIAIVMSFIEGMTIEQIVEKIGPSNIRTTEWMSTVAWMTERTLHALKCLHYNGIIHGDIKPQNIIIQPESHTAILIDFGLSKIRPEAGSRPKGYTEVFCSPEAKNGTPLLHQSDFYCLGLTMIYALSGNEDGDCEMVKSREVPENVPEPLCEFISRLLVYDILERPGWEQKDWPDWQKKDLCELFGEVRTKSFGERHSGMISIPGLDK